MSKNFDKSTYDSSFYSAQTKNTESSAEEVLDLALSKISPRSIVDVGCGSGHWLRYARDHFDITDILGLDFFVPDTELVIPQENFLRTDLSAPIELSRRFDLAISIEVAEHLPPASADTFVKSLTGLSDVVLFSAAIPKQGGNNHLNEQWPDYWERLFKEDGYVALDCLRRDLWTNPKVKVWHAQNIFFYVKLDKIDQFSILKNSQRGVWNIVHPQMFLSRNAAMEQIINHAWFYLLVTRLITKIKKTARRR
ncbi:MAG: class I SAM-dependent methyltransferase [Nitrososphaerales archaeon]